MERYHIYKLGIAILFYAVYCRRPMVNGLKTDDDVGSANKSSAKDNYYVYYQGVQGEPGIDFPVHARIPRTGFSCKDVESGYYADLDTDCQVFHICNEGTKVSFLCPNGTIFQQSDLICDWWFKVNCTNSPNLYVESAEQLRESHIRRKASRRVYNNDEAGKFHNQFSHRMDVSDEMQVGAESAGFYGSGLNSIATTKKERNPYPNHRTTYSEVKYYTNLPTPASVAKSTINNGKPFVVSTPKLGVYTTERSTFRYSPTVPTIRSTVEAVHSTYKQGKTTFGVRSTPRTRTDAIETFTNPPSVANGKSTTARKPKHNKNSFTIGLNSLQGAVPLKTQVSSTPSPKGSNKGVIRLNLSSDGGAKALKDEGTQNYGNTKSAGSDVPRGNINRNSGTSDYNHQQREGGSRNSGRYNSGKYSPSSSETSRGENSSGFTSIGEGQVHSGRNHPKSSNVGTYSNTGSTPSGNFGSYNNADHTGQNNQKSSNDNTGRYNHAETKSSVVGTSNSGKYSSTISFNNDGSYNSQTSNIGSHTNDENAQDSNFGLRNGAVNSNFGSTTSNSASNNNSNRSGTTVHSNSGQYNSYSNSNSVTTSNTVNSYSSQSKTGQYSATGTTPGFSHDNNAATLNNSGNVGTSNTASSSSQATRSNVGQYTQTNIGTAGQYSHSTSPPTTKSNTVNSYSSQSNTGHYSATGTTPGFAHDSSAATLSNKSPQTSHTGFSYSGSVGTSNTANRNSQTTRSNIGQYSQTNGGSAGQYSHSTSPPGSYNQAVTKPSTKIGKSLDINTASPDGKGERTLDLGENVNGFVSDAVLSLSADLQPPVSYSNVESGSVSGAHGNVELHTVAYNNGQTGSGRSGHSYSGEKIESQTVGYTNGNDNNNGQNNDGSYSARSTGQSSIETHTVGYNNDHTVTPDNSVHTSGYNTERSISDRNNDAAVSFATLLPPLRTAGHGNSIESSTRSPPTYSRTGKSHDGQTDRPSNGFFVTKTNTFRPAEFITADFNSGSITGSKNTYIPTTKAPIYTSTTTEYVSNTFGFVKPTGVPKPKPFELASTTERPILTTVEPDYEELYNLQYQISSASPFTNVPPTLPSSYHTNAYEFTSTRRPFNEHVDNMLDTLKEIADVRVNESPRPGLLVPPSVGPQTLHTLAVYFANALDNLVPEDQAAQEEMTTVDEDLAINSLLSKKTVSGYNELFMREQEPEEADAVEQDENDLNSEHSSNAVQSPRVRQLAKVFTQALSSYLDDPDMFRKVLQQVRPTEPPPLRTLPTDNPEEDELLNFSDADIKPELPRLPTPPPANPTWGYILAFNNSNNNHLDNNENLQTADTQSFVPGYNDIRVERTHWTQSPEVTKLWRNTLLVDPQTLNENLEKTERPESVDYELRALPTLHLNSTQVHGLLINFMNSTDDSAKLKRILDKLNTTQDEFLEKMKQIEENPLTRRLILLLVSECASNSTEDKADTVRDILSLANPNSSSESLQSSSTNWEAVALRSNLTLDRKPSAFTKLVDPNLKEEDQDARALQLLNSLYSIASKYGK